MAWRIEFYHVSRGTSPPQDFVRALPDKLRAKLSVALNLLENFGPHIGEQYVKKMAGVTNIYDLRASQGSDAVRLFFFLPAPDHVVILHGIRKKTQRTPGRDLATTSSRRLEYLRRQ